MNTCPTPAKWVLWCLAAMADEDGKPVPVDLVVGMCNDHRATVTIWAHRYYGHLGEGLVLPVEDLHVLQAHLMRDGSTDRMVGNVVGSVPVAV